MKVKAIFTNRKFSLNGLIEVIYSLAGFVVFVAAIGGFGWLVSIYPAETGAAVACIVTIAIVCCVLAGIFNTIFPKNKNDDDLEINKWVEDAKKKLEQLRAGENDESNR